jgi:hypothetical protein
VAKAAMMEEEEVSLELLDKLPELFQCDPEWSCSTELEISVETVQVVPQLVVEAVVRIHLMLHTTVATVEMLLNMDHLEAAAVVAQPRYFL